LSKKRRNDGPKGVKIIVTNLAEASAGAILRGYPETRLGKKVALLDS